MNNETPAYKPDPKPLSSYHPSPRPTRFHMGVLLAGLVGVSSIFRNRREKLATHPGLKEFRKALRHRGRYPVTAAVSTYRALIAEATSNANYNGKRAMRRNRHKEHAV